MESVYPESTRVTKEILNVTEAVAQRDMLMRQRGVRAATQDAGIWRDVTADKRPASKRPKRDELTQDIITELPVLELPGRPATPESGDSGVPWTCIGVGLAVALIVAMVVLSRRVHQ